MINLPRWRLTSPFPAFFDTESGTSIEMTAKVYGAMRELIDEYNKFAETIEKAFNDFHAETEKENELFKGCVSELLKNFIECVNTKIDTQNMKIDNAISFMKDNITETTTTIINNAINDNKIIIEGVYDPETESYYLTGRSVTE